MLKTYDTEIEFNHTIEMYDIKLRDNFGKTEYIKLEERLKGKDNGKPD